MMHSSPLLTTAPPSLAPLAPDTNGCLGNPCTGTNEVCVDKPAPQTGYTCACGTGYTRNTQNGLCEGELFLPSLPLPACHVPASWDCQGLDNCEQPAW